MIVIPENDICFFFFSVLDGYFFLSFCCPLWFWEEPVGCVLLGMEYSGILPYMAIRVSEISVFQGIESWHLAMGMD